VLTFDEPSHTYRWDGTVVPSVTQILAGWSPIAHLAPEILEAGRVRGTIVHQLTEYADEDDVDEAWCAENGYLGYVKAWLKFRLEHEFEPLLTEERVYHPLHRYAGTLDRLGRMRQVVGRQLRRVDNALVDIKSGVKDPTHLMQTAAYAAAVDPKRHHLIPRFCVYLRADGTYGLDEATNHAGDWSDFLACARHHHWRQRNGIAR